MTLLTGPSASKSSNTSPYHTHLESVKETLGLQKFKHFAVSHSHRVSESRLIGGKDRGVVRRVGMQEPPCHAKGQMGIMGSQSTLSKSSSKRRSLGRGANGSSCAAAIMEEPTSPEG